MGWKRQRLQAMGDEAFFDVHLVGTDGLEIGCNKAILASSCPIFKGMFFAGFKEASMDRCHLDFHSLVLSVIVKYCYCGEVDMDLIRQKSLSLGEEASVLVELREAGRYFGIEELSSTAEAAIGKLFCQESNTDNLNYQYASAFYTELLKRGQDKEPLGLALFQFAVENAMECFGPRALEHTTSKSHIYHAHPSALSCVLANNEDTYAVVKCLQTWFLLDRKSNNGYTDEEKRGLLAIAKDIDLRLLSTKQLSNIKPCPLFTSDRILQAFVHHCKDDAIAVEMPRKKPRLYISGAGLEYLNGFYKQVVMRGKMLDIFFKQVEHDGISCKAIVHRKRDENQWFVSLTNDDLKVQVDHDAVERVMEVYEPCVQKHLYESLGDEENRKAHVPPFNSWKCLEGTGPVPIVACIYQQIPNSANGN